MALPEQAPEPTQPPIAEEERRQFDRVPLRRKCTLSRPGSSMSYPAMTIDISAGGVGMFLTRDIGFLKGGDLELTFPASPEGPAFRRPVRLVYTNLFSLGTCFAGARFLEPLSREELTALLG